MVSATIVSRFSGSLPTSGSRGIPRGPLYPVEEVLALLDTRGGAGITEWTRKCSSDLQKYAIDRDDVIRIVRLAVRCGRFTGSEWCVQRPDGPWAACDSYSVVRREWNENAYRDMDIEYYVKFAIGKTGQILLLVSCHPSEDR